MLLEVCNMMYSVISHTKCFYIYTFLLMYVSTVYISTVYVSTCARF